MPKRDKLKSTLIIGSGPIIIGQACEFDYSGSQALRSLREDGIETILINSNPATIMTDPTMADHVYLLPLNTTSIVQILKEHPQIDAVLPTMGGQTALNLCIEADEKGIWEEHNVEIIGVDINAINITEDREQFRNLMLDIGIKMAPQATANSYLKGKEIAQEFGFPLVIRASYTLGGAGASIVYKEEDFNELLTRGLEISPIHEVMIDKALIGWKEYELELLRDSNDNVVIICSIENMDPMGIHTGDSITVAPAMTLSDTCYQKMRDMAIKMMRSIGDFSGGCNVQFAVSPDEKEDIIAVEINPRVSRSSALASKATGYPIAKIASKLAIGYNLDELENQITKSTSALFEPTLDYVIVKIPRWNFDKFEGSDRTLGLQMKSVGEVMGIGRSFQEALHKATQSLEIKRNGIGADGKSYKDKDLIVSKLINASWDRVFVIFDAIQIGMPLSTINELTKIDMWFLRQYEELYLLQKEISKYTIDSISRDLLLEAKQKGYGDRQIAHILNCLESQVYNKRQEMNINRVYKLVDTCAAEFTASTPYYYSTFENEIENKEGKKYSHNESVVSDKKKIIVLGSGPNRIGQGIEFDYCCVHGVLASAECGYETIMINCNPETVSTDFDIADKLYFEPVFWEHIYDIIRHENPEGVIVQLGGQTALKLSEKLDRYGIKIIGTNYKSLDLAEDRGSFSKLLKENNIPYPKFDTASSVDEALKVSRKLDFPILIRPSYVLGGQGMKIVINKKDLKEHVADLLKKMPKNKLLLDHYLDGAIEAEADAICDGKDIYIIGIMEHIEPCGIHSGDSNACLPPFNLGDLVLQQIIDHTKKIAKALNTIGLINIQFAIVDDMVYIIEANPRASRTVPFISKAYKEPYVNYATKVMLGEKKLKDFKFNPTYKGYAIKQPVFSFNKFPNVNKQLGPEMKSTGESILFIDNLQDEKFYELYSRRKMYLSK
ncbi:MAG: carbamoyl-phosphate synthase large subunit [Flavobacteriaceae bacterium]|jgi:carbamoyl-phosphate synthase large subunit|nr:carbamoyl-phosphate synthase large subunit [Flavobacteriaceae bacterium]MBT4113299.1 carbamoyl-phosphate synthase large subunit [Flavobacteriaceae bacterium]MBT4614706.1 carbamoyl-phosphate synthase large subunit [Flavobacteriaceae bacterium]MBT5247096.1 carbamoyl-phosphate synthase large subunit [Flavobacteriaceae bacterium]MBT5649752.1 carbamoyl-phosphate synthase large subunit [Flavobacteriaceae bacterium]